MLYLVRAGPSKFRFVCLFLLINCVPNTDKETMGQGARMTKCEQRINKCEASDQKIQRLKARQLPLFDPTNNIVKNFLSWLTGMGGGCRSDRQAQQLVSKRLKFFKFCCEDEDELTFDIVDNYPKEGIEQYGSGQWKAIIRDPEFRFQKGRTVNSLLIHAARRFGSLSKLP